MNPNIVIICILLFHYKAKQVLQSTKGTLDISVNSSAESGNNNDRNTPEGVSDTNVLLTANGNPVGDRLWMNHFALQLFRQGALDEIQYRKLLSLVDQALAKKYNNTGK